MRVSGSEAHLRIGFVPLFDAAPIIIAFELGYFSDEGLAVVLDRQIGWGNIRDKLSFGHLHASHALLGMPAFSQMGVARYPQRLLALASLGQGGNSIAVSRQFFEAGVCDSKSFRQLLNRRSSALPPLLLAHVFDCSTHHYLLREWLTAGGIDPDRDVQLCVLPPPQMVRQLSEGHLAGFCVGEPWGADAEQRGFGNVLALTNQLTPAHPEKVFAVTENWLQRHREQAGAAVRALLRGGEFCGNPANRSKLIEVLAAPQYLNVSEATLERTFSLAGSRGDFWAITAANMLTSSSDVTWLLERMRRWGHLPADVNISSVAERSVDPTLYHDAIASSVTTCAGASL